MKFRIRIGVIFFVFLVFLTNLAAQNAFYDALYLIKHGSDLEKHIGKECDVKFKKFLETPFEYCKDADDLDVGKLKMELKKAKRSHTEEVEVIMEEPSSPKFFSSTFQSNLIDALGTIIAERFKEDITIMYINKFRKKFNEFNETIFIEPLFPEIFKLVKDGDPFNFDSLGKEIKKAISTDLRNLPGNMLTFLQDKENKIKAKIEELKEGNLKKILEKLHNLKSKPLFPYFELAVDVSKKLVDGSHPIDLLNYLELNYKSLANINCENEIYKDIYKVIHLINIFQHNLRALDESTDNAGLSSTWVGFEQLKELIYPENGNKNGIKYFLALIYLRNKDFFKGAYSQGNVEILLKEDEAKNLANFIDKKVLPVYQIVVKLDGFSKKKNMTTEDYVDYMQTVLNLISEIYDKFSSEKKNKVKDIVGFAQLCLNIYKSIYKKDYTMVISNALEIIKSLQKTNDQLSAGAESTWKDGFMIDKIRKNVNRVEKLEKCEKKSIKELKFLSFLKFLFKYGKFMEDLASAKDAAEMKGLISSVIMPPGSFLKKRKTPFSLTISAHPGLYMGSEFLESEMKNEAFVYGFTAPVGLEICFIKKPSVGLLLSAVDLGAVVSHRVQSSSEYNGFPKEITFKQVLSPGISINVGLKKSPITFGLGIQWTPQLRKIIEGDTVTGEKTKALRIFGRVSWDIPLISITRLRR